MAISIGEQLRQGLDAAHAVLTLVGLFIDIGFGRGNNFDFPGGQPFRLDGRPLCEQRKYFGHREQGGLRIQEPNHIVLKRGHAGG